MDDANTWASLPVDLLVEILRRLDTTDTTVVAFAGTCKPWRRAIIANVSSLKLHPDRFNPNLLLGFFHRQWLAGRHLPRLQHVPGPFDKMLRPDVAADTMASMAVDAKLYDEPLSSRDGFVLVGGSAAGGLCLCNPLAGTCRFIPSPVIGASRPCRFVLVTDPDEPPTATYAGGVRILAVMERDDCHYRGGMIYQIFSSNSGEWGPVRRSTVGDDHRFRFFLCDGDKDVVVCRSSVVYWLVTLVAHYGHDMRGRRCVLAVDVNDERAWMERVELPETIMEMGSGVVSDSMLALATTEDGRLSLVSQLPGQPLQVWELGGGGEWTLRRRIDVPEEVMIPSNCFLNVGHAHVHISGFCPRSGCLFGDVEGEDILIDVERGVVRRTRRYGVGRVTKYPYEMDWPTYISKMKYF
nr:unnamed protein product [Digitaria exilis]